jgi:hypothetical protein
MGMPHQGIPANEGHLSIADSEVGNKHQSQDYQKEKLKRLPQ